MRMASVHNVPLLALSIWLLPWFLFKHLSIESSTFLEEPKLPGFLFFTFLTMKSFTSTLAATLCVGSALAKAPSTAGTEWKKTQFLDDFTGANGKPPSSANWIMQTGTQYPGGPANWGSGEVETYTNLTKNVKQAGSKSHRHHRRGFRRNRY